NGCECSNGALTSDDSLVVTTTATALPAAPSSAAAPAHAQRLPLSTTYTTTATPAVSAPPRDDAREVTVPITGRKPAESICRATPALAPTADRTKRGTPQARKIASAFQ